MRKLIVLVGLGLIVILLLAVGISSYGAWSTKHARQKVSDEFVTDVLKNDATNSYRLFSGDALNSQDPSEWQATVDSLSTFFSGHAAKLISTSHTDPLYIYTYAISGSDGNYHFVLVLVKGQSGWRVQSFNSVLQT